MVTAACRWFILGIDLSLQYSTNSSRSLEPDIMHLGRTAISFGVVRTAVHSIHFAVFVMFCILCRNTGSNAAAEEPREHEPWTQASAAAAARATGTITRRFEIYNPHSFEDLKAVKRMGFTQVILDRHGLHPTATELGLDVVLANWWTLDTEPQEVEKSLARAAQVDPSHLIAISMMDEPERYAPDTPFVFYKTLYGQLRQHLDRDLPQVKLEISHWGPLSSWPPEIYEAFVTLYKSADRMRLMPYPDLDESPLREVYLQILRSRHIMQLAKRDLPQVVILQTWVLPTEPKLPTIAELRVMAYEAILAGADTVSFYNYDPETWSHTPNFARGFADLMEELTGFADRFGGARVDSKMGSDGILSATIHPAAGPPIPVIVNTNRNATKGWEPLAVSVHLPPEPAMATSSRNSQAAKCHRHSFRKVMRRLLRRVARPK
jgi:hypothetical protein